MLVRLVSSISRLICCVTRLLSSCCKEVWSYAPSRSCWDMPIFPRRKSIDCSSVRNDLTNRRASKLINQAASRCRGAIYKPYTGWLLDLSQNIWGVPFLMWAYAKPLPYVQYCKETENATFCPLTFGQVISLILNGAQ